MTTILLAIIGAILNRIRGGWFKEEVFWGSTQTVRAIWAVPTGLFVWLLTGTSVWWHLPVLIISCFLSYALLGHGGHMVFSPEWWKLNWERSRPQDQTEATTRFWLIPIFGGEPNEDWPLSEVYLFHLIGMSFIGVLRSAIMIAPVIFFGHDILASIGFIALGSLLGIIYLIGWQLYDGIKVAELIAGAFYWSALFTLFGER